MVSLGWDFSLYVLAATFVLVQRKCWWNGNCLSAKSYTTSEFVCLDPQTNMIVPKQWATIRAQFMTNLQIYKVSLLHPMPWPG